MTTVMYDPGNFRLRLTGHAKSAESMDPICAGASALAWALVEAATERADYRASLQIEPQKPEIDVRCDPRDEARKDCRYMFEIILGGLMLIAEAYPENMQIRIGG